MSAKFKTAFLGVTFFLFFSYASYAETVETKYFSISFCPACSVTEFASKIGTESSIRFETYGEAGSDIKSVIKSDIDTLYLEVCDVLDMHLNSYHGKINVYPDNITVSKIAFGDVQIIDSLLPSIYVPSQNTIHVSLKDVNTGMLAHEMAHVLISNYFVVAPGPKVQEILAGYVEYSVRKRMGNLPRSAR